MKCSVTHVNGFTVHVYTTCQGTQAASRFGTFQLRFLSLIGIRMLVFCSGAEWFMFQTAFSDCLQVLAASVGIRDTCVERVSDFHLL